MTDTLTKSDSDQLLTAASALEDASPLEILRWASDRFGPRLTFATGFGAEGCVLIDLIGQHGLAIDVFTLDTGLLFPETYELWQRLGERYGLTIRGVRPKLTVDEQAAAHGSELWERQPDQCCQMRKVSPLVAELSAFDAWLTGIRRDQTAARTHALAIEWDEKYGLSKVNPLIRWTKKDVWAYLLKHEVPYNPLHNHGYPSIGCLPCTSRVAENEDDRAGRWRGIAKSECGLHVQEPAMDEPEPVCQG